MGHSGNGRRVYVGDRSPGKMKERLPSSLGGGLEPLLYDSTSCIFAEAGKAVPGVTARADPAHPGVAHALSPLRGDGPYTQSQDTDSHSAPN